MPMKRKSKKASGEQWYIIDASNCQPKVVNGDKPKRPQKVKIDVSPQDIDSVLPTEHCPLDVYDSDTVCYNWVASEEGFEILGDDSPLSNPERMSVTDLSIQEPQFNTSETNLEKVLAEACEEPLPELEPKERVVEEDKLSSDQAKPSETLAEGKLSADSKPKKKKNKKRKPSKTEDVTVEESVIAEQPPAVRLFSEIVCAQSCVSSDPISCPEQKPVICAAVEESVIEQPPMECSVQKSMSIKVLETLPQQTQTEQAKKRKRGLGSNLVDSFSDQETTVEVSPPTNEWITPRPLKPSKQILKEKTNDSHQPQPPKTETRQKKRTKSTKPKADPKSTEPEKKQELKENIQTPEPKKQQSNRSKNKQKNPKRQSSETERRRVSRSNSDEEQNAWPMLWFKNPLQALGLRRK